MATPTTISPVTHLMTAAYDDNEKIIPARGFSSFFIRSNDSRTTFVPDSESFSYDIRRGDKKISKILTRENAARSLGSVQKANVGMKFQNSSNVFPAIVETASADWNQTLSRVSGEDPYGNLSRFDRLRIILVDEAMTAMKKIAGRIEKMSAEVLTTAKITLDDTPGSQYDFKRATTNTFAAPTVWTDAAATPLTDLDNLSQAIRQNGKVAPNGFVFGKSSYDAFVNNVSIKALADNRKYWFIEAGSERSISALPPDLQWMVDAGFKHRGNVSIDEGEFPIFTYNEQYQNDAGTWVDYMNAKQVFGFYSNARVDRYFGPSLTIPPSAMEQQEMLSKLGISVPSISAPPASQGGLLEPAMFNWDFDTPKGAQTSVFLRTHIAPVYIPTQVDSFGLITGVVA
jgi:hypothetical protein